LHLKELACRGVGEKVTARGEKTLQELEAPLGGQP
jgi:hypothetical protein